MSADFDNRTVLVAGASAGIGKGIASAFAACGANTILGGRRLEPLLAATDEIGESARALCGDFSDAKECERLLGEAGALDVLVVCYGDTDMPPGFETLEGDWQRLINGNLSGPARLARLAGVSMKARSQGVILFIGSICGQEVLGAPVAYNVGKAGLRALMKTMAHELGPHGVRVNMISPGNVIFEGGRWATKRAANPTQVEQMLNSKVPLRRFGTPQDIAAAALFLCSQRASFITGADLTVDGGQTISI